MTAEAPASLRRRGLTRAVHERREDQRVAVSGRSIFRHFEPELRARFLRSADPEETAAGEGGA